MRTKKSPSSPSSLRFGLTLAIVIMVITSPILTLVDPTQVSAATTSNNNSNRIDSSGYHSTPSIPAVAPASPLSSPTPRVPEATNQRNDGDFATQATLSLTRAAQTNNFVASKAYYDITFRTATGGVIKTVEIDFPPGTYVGAATLVEIVGIGPGTVAATGSTGTGMKITYTVTNAANVPAFTDIRIQLANINNPPDASSTLAAAITTKAPDGAIIDGPSSTNVYSMKQIGTNDIADNAATIPKIADNSVTDAKLSLDSAYILWDDITSGNREIIYKRNTISFDPTKDLTTCCPGASQNPAVAASGNNLYVVWRDDTPGNNEILFRRSTDGGASFGDTVIDLSNNAGSSLLPAVAASGNNVYVVWHDLSNPVSAEILYRRSTDGGATFGATVNLSNNGGDSASPAVTASGKNVYVVWQDDTPGNMEILYRSSTDGGATFGATDNLSNNGGNSFSSAVAASGKNVYVVWEDFIPGNEILYRSSTDGGATFGATVNLSNNAGSSLLPAVAASGNNVYVVWNDDTPGNNEILFRRSTDGGATFGATVNLSNNAGSSLLPAVAASGNNVYVVWDDNAPGNNEILYKSSADGGAIFGATTNLSNNAGGSVNPSIAAMNNLPI